MNQIKHCAFSNLSQTLGEEGGEGAGDPLTRISAEYFKAMEDLLSVIHQLSYRALSLAEPSPIFEGKDSFYHT